MPLTRRARRGALSRRRLAVLALSLHDRLQPVNAHSQPRALAAPHLRLYAGKCTMIARDLNVG
jgi:hypothetical protein